jgi:hypothetical protein
MSKVKHSEEEDHWAESFGHDLKAVDCMSFPGHCSVCGMAFGDAETFLKMTTAAFNDEGVNETYDMEGHRVLDVGRFCQCGHLMVEEFRTRRDESLHGKIFRSIFSLRMRQMRSLGTEKSIAHDKLLDLMHDQGREAVIALQVR